MTALCVGILKHPTGLTSWRLIQTAALIFPPKITDFTLWAPMEPRNGGLPGLLYLTLRRLFFQTAISPSRPNPAAVCLIFTVMIHRPARCFGKSISVGDACVPSPTFPMIQPEISFMPRRGLFWLNFPMMALICHLSRLTLREWARHRLWLRLLPIRFWSELILPVGIWPPALDFSP